MLVPSSSPSNLRAPDLAGRPIIANRFAVFAKIAEGGMAGVYRAWDQQLRAWRAIKVLLPEYAERPNLRARFASEARALAAIDHPNVVRVFDISADAPLPFIVMELAEGGTLNDWLDRNGQMPARMAVEVAIQVANGLGAAHASGVVHRDVKPQNILLDARGRCLVTDFGIARVTFSDHLTRTGSSMGTVGYMAPEQRADAKIVDGRADVYGIGAMLYKLVTGVVLTDLFLVEHDPKLLAPVPHVLRPVVLQACRHDREQRYQDTDALAAALEKVLQSLPPLMEGVPVLGGLPDDPSLDRSVQDFSSIALLFESPKNPRHLAAPAPLRSPAERAVAREAAVRRTPPPVPSPSPHTLVRRPPGAATPQPPIGRVAPPQAPAPAPGLLGPHSLVRTALSATALTLLLIWFGSVLVAAWSLRGDAEEELVARQVLFDTLATEEDLLPALLEHQIDPVAVTELGELYQRWQVAKGPERLTLADRFAARTTALAAPLLSEQGNDLASMRARNLARAYGTWSRADEAFREDASGPLGRTAISFGFAPKYVDPSP